MAACLKQALPSLTVPQLIRLIQQSSSRYKHPDRAVGYGIPDFYKAYQNGLKDEKRNDR
jgi:serine protease AprX